MQNTLSLKIEDDDFVFDYRRVIYWPKKKILIASDLHWGKTTFLQKHGIAISDEVFENDLLRLGNLLRDYDVKTLLVLGDLIHHEKSLSKEVISRIIKFRQEFPVELVLLMGNHDKYTTFPKEWGLLEEHDITIDGFYFTHEHEIKKKNFQFSGHLHPMMKLKAGYDVLRLPAFIVGNKFCYLPAFSELAGGSNIVLKKSQKAIVILPDGVEIFEK